MEEFERELVSVSKVYYSDTAEHEQQLSELTLKMHKYAIGYKDSLSTGTKKLFAGALADTVLEFLKVSGWKRP